MTQEQYFEMCEALGTEPVESEIPVSYGDLPVEIQQVLQLYGMLQDTWEGFNGIYLGKNLSGIKDFLDILNIDLQDRQLYLVILKLIDKLRVEEINKHREKPA